MKFSHRLAHGSAPNAISALLAEKRRAGEVILDLTESNPTHAGIVYPPDFLDALADRRALLYEPEPFGLPAARERIAPSLAALEAAFRPLLTKLPFTLEPAVTLSEPAVFGE